MWIVSHSNDCDFEGNAEDGWFALELNRLPRRLSPSTQTVLVEQLRRSGQRRPLDPIHFRGAFRRRAGSGSDQTALGCWTDVTAPGRGRRRSRLRREPFAHITARRLTRSMLYFIP
jgi:hypothetical protein